MRIRTTAILAIAAAAASMVFLAGCGGDGPEGAPPPPATTKAAPERYAGSYDSINYNNITLREYCRLYDCSEIDTPLREHMQRDSTICFNNADWPLPPCDPKNKDCRDRNRYG